jgi:triacylglycerol lipase
MPARRRRQLRAWALGLIPVVVLLAVAGVRLVQARTSDRDAEPGPVLLVAGYGGPTSALEGLGDRLRAGGRRTVLVPVVGDNTGDLYAQARSLDAAARRELAGGAPSVDVVGYSAGGVVARIWAARFGGADVARRIVTLGSPHHGTDVAQLAAGALGGGCPVACRQLAPGGDVLRDLPETPSGPRWTSVWSATDEIVSPPSSSRLRGAVDVELQAVCPGVRVGHGSLPTDPLPATIAVRALTGAGLTAAPPPSDCATLRGS